MIGSKQIRLNVFIALFFGFALLGTDLRAQSLFSDGTPLARSRSFDVEGQASNFDPHVTGQFTIEAWVYARGLPSPESSGIIVGRPADRPTPSDPNGLSTGTAVWALRFEAGQNSTDPPQYTFEMMDGDPANPQFVTVSVPAPSTEGWVYLGAAYDGQTLELSVNGSSVTTDASGLTPVAGVTGLYVGGFNTDHFVGYIDEVRLWSTAKSGSEMIVLSGTRPDPAAPDMLGYWDFNDGSNALQLPDLTGKNSTMRPSFGARYVDADYTDAAQPTAPPVVVSTLESRDATTGGQAASYVISADPAPSLASISWNAPAVDHISLGDSSPYNTVSVAFDVDIDQGADVGFFTAAVQVSPSLQGTWPEATLDLPITVHGADPGQQEITSGPIAVTMYNDGRVGRDHDQGGRFESYADIDPDNDAHPLFSGALVFMDETRDLQAGQLYSGANHGFLRADPITQDVSSYGKRLLIPADLGTSGNTCYETSAIEITETVHAPGTNINPWMAYDYEVRNNGCEDLTDAYLLWQLDFDVASDYVDQGICDENRHFGMVRAANESGRTAGGAFGLSPAYDFVCGAYFSGQFEPSALRDIVYDGAHDFANTGDVRLVVGYGPLHIPAQSSVSLAMALGYEDATNFTNFDQTRAEGQPQVGTVTFEVDMSLPIGLGYFDPNSDEVHIQSVYHGWDFDAGYTKLTDDDNDGIYSLTVPELDYPAFIYKYRTTAPDAIDGGYESLGLGTDYFGFTAPPPALGFNYETQQSGYFNRTLRAASPSLPVVDRFSQPLSIGELWRAHDLGLAGQVAVGGVTLAPDRGDYYMSTFMYDADDDRSMNLYSQLVSDPSGPVVESREQIYIVGNLDVWYGQPEVVVDQLQRLGPDVNNDYPLARTIPSADLVYHGDERDAEWSFQHVRVDDITLDDPDQWPSVPMTEPIVVVDAQVDGTPIDIIIVRGLSDVEGTPVPQGPLSLTGILYPYIGFDDSGNQTPGVRLYPFEQQDPSVSSIIIDGDRHMTDDTLRVPLRIDRLGALDAIGVEFTIASSSEFASLDDVQPGPAVVDDLGAPIDGAIFLTTQLGTGIRVGVASSTAMGSASDILAYLVVRTTNVGGVDWTLSDTWINNTVGALSLDRASDFSVYVDYGDIDRNGMLRAYDAALLLRALVEVGPPLSRTQTIIANVDGSEEEGVETLTSADATAILRRVLDIDPCFAVEGCLTKSAKSPAEVLAEIGEITRDGTSLHIPLRISPHTSDLSSLEISMRGIHGGMLQSVEGAPQGWISAVGSQSVALAGAMGVADPIDLTLVMSVDAAVSVDELEIAVTPDGAAAHTVNASALEVPTSLALHGVYPSPFGANARVEIATPEGASVTVELFDMIGRRVQVLARGTYGAGRHLLLLDGTSLPAGMYMLRIFDGETIISRPVIHL